MSNSLDIFYSDLSKDIVIDHGYFNNLRVGLLEPSVSVFVNKSSVFCLRVPYHSAKPNTEKTKNPKIPYPTSVFDFEKYELSREFGKYYFTEVSCSGKMVYCVDEIGNVCVYKYKVGFEDTLLKEDSRMTEEKRPVKKRKLDVKPLEYQTTIENKNPPFESGCSYLSIHPASDETIATSVYFSKELRIYDKGNLLQTYNFSSYPTNVSYFTRENSTILGVIEEEDLLIFDERLSKSVGKIEPRSGVLKSFDYCGNTVAVADDSRGVLLYDIRKWSVFKKIKKSLKTGVCFTKFSKMNDLLVIAGSNEMMTCQVKGTKKSDSIHFDSKILGFEVMNDDVDTIGTVSKTGRVYFLRNLKSIL